MKKKFLSAVLILLSLSVLISCKNQKYYRQDVSNNILYLETPCDAPFPYVLQHTDEFQELKIEDRSSLNRLLTDKKNLLWLKISFELDEQLKNKSIALYIANLQSSSWLFCNGNSIRKYGSTPPKAMSCGNVAQYFMFPNSIVNYDGENTIYIQVWPGPLGSISNTVFVAEQSSVFLTAERHTFFNAKINIAFTTIMLLISFLYSLLSFVLRKNDKSLVYLFYSLLTLFTSFFLLPFCISEISWIFPPFVSYDWIVKLFLYISAIITVYFANSFMLEYLKITFSKKKHLFRIFLFLVIILIVIFMPDASYISKTLPVELVLISIDFIICSPNLFKALYDKEKLKDAKKLVFGFMPVMLSLTADGIIRVVFKIDTLPFITLYGWQITIYIFLFYLVQEFGGTYVHNISLKNQVEELNSNLEEIVAMRTKELSEANYVLSKGLESVAHVQKNFLPEKNHIFKGWEFSAYYRPLDNNVSGDLYDYYYTDENLDGLGIFDVSGHGIAAGLMTILSKGIIVQHFSNAKEQHVSLSKVLEDINTTYIKEKVNVDNYITGLLFRFFNFDDEDACKCELANAGHPYPLLYSSKENSIQEIKVKDTERQYGIIGVEGLDISFPTVNFSMEINDILICFTDGITESTNTKNKEFSKYRIMEIVQENSKLNSSQIVQAIINEFEEFTKNTVIRDDITLIVLKRNNSKQYLEGI